MPVRLFSILSLEDLAAIISNKVLGGVLLGGQDQYIYDEVPAVFSQSSVLGAEFILSGYGGQDGYWLLCDVSPNGRLDEVLKTSERTIVDISCLVVELLKGVDGISAAAPPAATAGEY